MASTERPTISDTARWVAAYRAHESARPDALFHDPYAARLAGPLGENLAKTILGRFRSNGWPMIARTCAIDDLVLQSIAEGADVVINLAAGLDTRPYRMELPKTLRWIEADLPVMIDEKEQVLAGETPKCLLTRERVDLSNRALRTAFLDRALLGTKKALVITEGLLVYLDSESVKEFATDLAKRTEIAWWMHDLASPAILKMLQKATKERLGESAQMKFGPKEGVSFFLPLGWKPSDIRDFVKEAARLRRLPPLLRLVAFLPQANPYSPGNRRPWGGVIRYTHA